jgi:GTP-binding protein Era
VTRSGIIALAGRPNVGKSTLVNAIVGEKVAITSDRPQTTRRAIRGVLTNGDCQLVIVDLPGVQRPRDALTRRMAGRVRQELADADAALLVLNAEQVPGRGDRFIAHELAGGNDVAVTVAVNKVDRCTRDQTAAALAQAADLLPQAELFPVSARTGAGVQALVEHLCALLPAGPFLFDAASVSDQPRSVQLAELVREAVIRRTVQELPHAVEVVIDDVHEPHPGLTVVRALIWVESPSQRGIVIGAGGRMIKAIGIAARPELERELAGKVHLELVVRVRRGWRADEALLDRLGID